MPLAGLRRSNYQSLRIVAFVVGTLAVLLCLNVVKKIYSRAVLPRYLFVLFIISSFAFTEYFVTSKQYTMEFLLSIGVLWQLHELLQLQATTQRPLQLGRYLLLCGSFIVAPFFSYTYPIAVAPVFVMVLLINAGHAASNVLLRSKLKAILLTSVPLAGCAASIFCFYLMDVKQLMTDNGMYGFWNFLFFDHAHKLYSLTCCGYRLFAQVGSGLLFENIVGVLGCIAFAYGWYSTIKRYWQRKSIDAPFRLYSCLLISLAFLLFLLKPRLRNRFFYCVAIA